MKQIYNRIFFFILFLLFFHKGLFADEISYNPLSLHDENRIQKIDLSFKDKSRNREIPVFIYLPDEKKDNPVIIFSHGLGGSRYGSTYLGNHWAGRGYAVIFVQHPGSDTSVWEGKKLLRRMMAMKWAANARNFELRVKDVPAVLDQLKIWNETEGHRLYKKLDLNRVGMSGHSFGAATTQAVSGQVFENGQEWTDTRIKASVLFSPRCPTRIEDPAKSFGSVKIPWMLMTGTRDVVFIGDDDLESDLRVFPVLPLGAKYELILYEAEHSIFVDQGMPGDKMKRNPNHHRAILALSTAFWDAYIMGDSLAKKWLDGDECKAVLETKDEWKRK